MRFKKFDLNGKKALITGAAGLLGREHAAALLECSAAIIMTDISMPLLEDARAELLREFPGGEIDLHVMNVTDEGEIQNVQDVIDKSKKELNILINNAAVDPKVPQESSTESSRLENFKREEWDFQISVGLTGAFLCSKVFGQSMAKSKNGGVIVNIASDLSVIAPDQRLYQKEHLIDDRQPVKPVTYSVVKHGLIGLTKYLATYWPNKVRCNALSPGGVFNGQNELFVEKLCELIPLGRMAHINEYRSAIQFLSSDASSYMTGQNIVIDGGRSTL